MRKCIIIVLLFISSFAHSTIYYVSNSGNDANNGTTIETPWQTLTKINATTFTAGDQILFNRGDSFYGSLSINYSGSIGNPIIFGAYGSGSNPVITGFTAVNSWTNTGGNIWESTDVASGLTSCNMVTINGVNTERGRWPNDDAEWSGFLNIDSRVGSVSIQASELTGTPDWTGAEVSFKSGHYIIYRRTITDQVVDTIKFDAGTYAPPQNYGFIIHNALATLDKQNEWYYNPSTFKLSIYSTTEPSNIKIATVDKLISINNNATGHYLTFENIDFEGANQYAIYRSYSALVNNGLIIQNCNFNYSGISAISTKTDGLTVSNCTINNSNTSAIWGGWCDHTSITDCTISNTGLLQTMRSNGSGIGNSSIDLGYVNKVNVERNKITNSSYCGVSFYGDSITVKNNFIDNFCSVLDDGGGIYTYTANQPTMHDILIEGNICINGIGSPDGTNYRLGVFYVIASGIYLDFNSSNVRITNNSTAHTKFTGIRVSAGKYNELIGNTVYDATHAAIRINSDNSATYSPEGYVINDNILVAKSGQYAYWLTSAVNNILETGTYSNNTYARPIDDTSTLWIEEPSQYNGTDRYKTLAQWQIFSEQDLNSHVSPYSVTSDSELHFAYNSDTIAKPISIPFPAKDINGNTHYSSINLQPYTSAVLFRDDSIPNPAYRRATYNSRDGKIYRVHNTRND